jgi:alanine racemase
MRPVQSIIRSGAFVHNLSLARAIPRGSSAYPVIKANGYGHGVELVARALSHADGFCIIELDAAVRLRERGITPTKPIMLLPGLFEPGELRDVLAHHLDIVVHNDQQLAWLEEQNAAFANQYAKSLTVWLKFNSGMNRLGFMPEAAIARAAYERLKRLAIVKEIIFMTHFARADEPEIGVTEALARMAIAEQGLRDAGFGRDGNYRKSFCNSAATIDYPQAHGHIVRPGIMTYGATPFAHKSAKELGLKPAMRFTSQVVAIQEIKAGETVGYGGKFTATRTDKLTRIAIVACGYADGYPRHAPVGTPIAVAGVRTVTAGRVAMDTLFADITDIPQAQLGSDVELWGELVPVDEVATAAGTIGYELLCAIAPRVRVVEA